MLKKRSQGIGFARHEIIATTFFVALVFLFRELSGIVGLTGGISAWRAQASVPYV